VAPFPGDVHLPNQGVGSGFSSGAQRGVVSGCEDSQLSNDGGVKTAASKRPSLFSLGGVAQLLPAAESFPRPSSESNGLKAGNKPAAGSEAVGPVGDNNVPPAVANPLNLPLAGCAFLSSLPSSLIHDGLLSKSVESNKCDLDGCDPVHGGIGVTLLIVAGQGVPKLGNKGGMMSTNDEVSPASADAFGAAPGVTPGAGAGCAGGPVHGLEEGRNTGRSKKLGFASCDCGMGCWGAWKGLGGGVAQQHPGRITGGRAGGRAVSKTDTVAGALGADMAICV